MSFKLGQTLTAFIFIGILGGQGILCGCKEIKSNPQGKINKNNKICDSYPLGVNKKAESVFSCIEIDKSGCLLVGNRGLRSSIQKINLTDWKTEFIISSDNTDNRMHPLQVGAISSLALDSKGNILFCDQKANCIRCIDTSTGAITIIAGNEKRYGYEGDGGLAVAALLNAPTQIAVDLKGNLFIADTFNHCIRRVNALTNVIETIAGKGICNVNLNSGSKPSHFNTVISIEDLFTKRMRDVTANGYDGDGGLAINATLSVPSGIAIDTDGNLFIADTFNDCIRRVDKVTGLITTVAANKSKSYDSIYMPEEIKFDKMGNLLIVCPLTNRVLCLDLKTNKLECIAGNGERGYCGDGGLAVKAKIGAPTGIVIDSANNLFIVNEFDKSIRKVDGKTKVITTVWNQ